MQMISEKAVITKLLVLLRVDILRKKGSKKYSELTAKNEREEIAVCMD